MAKKEKENSKKEMTSEEYRQEADEHMDTLKNEWKLFAKTGIFVLAAGIAVIIMCIAWFANNRQVTGRGMSIQTAGSDFELASAGTASGKWDDKFEVAPTPGVERNIGEAIYSATDGGHTSISWTITADSNMNNVNNDTNIGISPGDRGKITFYIIAQKKGTLNITLDISLKGWGTDENSNNVAVTDDLQELLEGHILLFAGYDEGNNTYKGWISKDAAPWTLVSEDGFKLVLSEGDNDKYTLTWTADVEEEKVYPVTIYWIWPEVLGEYIFKDQTYIENCLVLFPDDANTLSGIPSGLFAAMCNTADRLLSNRYFKWALSSDDNSESLKSEFVSLVTEALLNGMRNGENSALTKYGKVCSYYNMADQYLGENVRYLELKVDAQ